MTLALLSLNRYANDCIEDKMPLLTRWVRVTDWYSIVYLLLASLFSSSKPPSTTRVGKLLSKFGNIKKFNTPALQAALCTYETDWNPQCCIRNVYRHVRKKILWLVDKLNLDSRIRPPVIVLSSVMYTVQWSYPFCNYLYVRLRS
jgi:hypothetical protein